MNKNSVVHALAVLCLATGCAKHGDRTGDTTSAQASPMGTTQGDESSRATSMESGDPSMPHEMGTASTTGDTESAMDRSAAGSSVSTSNSAPALPPSANTAAAQTDERLTDEQIAKITEVVDTGEVEQARVAEKRAKNARVKRYAAHMITQHTQSKKKGTTLAKRENMEPKESTTAQGLSADASRTLDTLKDADGESFDTRYIDAQINQHQTVVGLIDSKLLPSASSPELKARLEEARSMVSRHLEEAREIRQNLATADSTSTGAGSDARGASGTPDVR